jgi:hypothetical protein
MILKAIPACQIAALRHLNLGDNQWVFPPCRIDSPGYILYCEEKPYTRTGEISGAGDASWKTPLMKENEEKTLAVERAQEILKKARVAYDQYKTSIVELKTKLADEERIKEAYRIQWEQAQAELKKPWWKKLLGMNQEADDLSPYVWFGRIFFANHRPGRSPLGDLQLAPALVTSGATFIKHVFADVRTVLNIPKLSRVKSHI